MRVFLLFCPLMVLEVCSALCSTTPPPPWILIFEWLFLKIFTSSSYLVPTFCRARELGHLAQDCQTLTASSKSDFKGHFHPYLETWKFENVITKPTVATHCSHGHIWDAAAPCDYLAKIATVAAISAILLLLPDPLAREQEVGRTTYFPLPILVQQRAFAAREAEWGWPARNRCRAVEKEPLLRGGGWIWGGSQWVGWWWRRKRR